MTIADIIERRDAAIPDDVARFGRLGGQDLSLAGALGSGLRLTAARGVLIVLPGHGAHGLSEALHWLGVARSLAPARPWGILGIQTWDGTGDGRDPATYLDSATLRDVVRAAVRYAAAQSPGAPVVLAGFSRGATEIPALLARVEGLRCAVHMSAGIDVDAAGVPTYPAIREVHGDVERPLLGRRAIVVSGALDGVGEFAASAGRSDPAMMDAAVAWYAARGAVVDLVRGQWGHHALADPYGVGAVAAAVRRGAA